jgi:hypothetical protein
MGTRTIGKVQVFGRDRRKWEWKTVLLENIPADSIPEEYGGIGPPVLSKAQ